MFYLSRTPRDGKGRNEEFILRCARSRGLSWEVEGGELNIAKQKLIFVLTFKCCLVFLVLPKERIITTGSSPFKSI